ncbi:MAG TPA: 3-hydroxyacyl-CoA dehydrogenase NAD-binding domain-containing protein [Cyclobacteriaceae bacterium]|nr:3-hydroxybutyryl-CoA dehydrogenase [Cyclobacteriaceae bacterium]HMV10162.1 3-hydroxyacyl-CoA dehydrogenase NAD-binding domain-containing protein [Cyclobacteriaceae bacterium]HMV91778.1 3-hydroxyacyl-CoA dehydrogenase NAD-binding domain-containing protein [Cyclobacteriaceae bacterium]HMX00523.1 3-hydroxyacyl-CoA dehydrogenase NAD-binding domain-containing protein [Cyclobacteriaceae bacterium]HMX49602.1 3-hydroxyacyl-CoA dehydrogenase NAD-binding domain-containing protein [Cyclobacteriaceae ba
MNVESIKTVAIAGAGTMGQGIAQVCALAGFDVALYDVKADAVKAGIASIESSLQKSVDKNKLTADAKKNTLSRIKSCNDLNQLRADLVIEAIVERLEIKRELLRAIEKNNSGSILTTNTSSIPVTQIAAGLDERSRFAGLHFFNPAALMKLVEIVQGTETSSETIETLKSFSFKLGKTSVLVKDSPGFIVNRVARHYYVEALKMLEENSADVKTIDHLLRASGFKMGAFELMDLIGLDVNFSVTSSMFNAFHQDPKFRPSRIQQQKVDAGHLGVKSGKGFYNY